MARLTTSFSHRISAKNMAHSIPFPNTDYTEDIHKSHKYTQLSNQAGKITAKYFKISAVIFWLPWLLSIIGLVKDLPQYTFFFTSGVAFLIAILAIVLPKRHAMKDFMNCDQCKSKLKREPYGSYEFFTCKQCHTYAIGGDYS